MNVKIRVLIAEDDENDAFLLRRAIAKVDPLATFHIVDNGADAIAYMKGDGKYADRDKYPFPRVLITDLKMPKFNGFELLAWLLEHPDCNVIPKVVLSASNQTEDIVKAYQLGANIYFKKPGRYEELVTFVELNFRMWSLAELPPDDIKKCG